MAAPRMFLYRRPRGGFVGEEKLTLRFEKFMQWEWLDLIFECAVATEEASTVSHRRGWRVWNPLEQGAAEHLRLLDSVWDSPLVFGWQSSWHAQLCLSKDDGGVRGIAAGDVIKRLVGTHHGSTVVTSSEGHHRSFSVHPLPGQGASAWHIQCNQCASLMALVR